VIIILYQINHLIYHHYHQLFDIYQIILQMNQKDFYFLIN